MPFRVDTVTPADAGAIAQVFLAAYSKDTLIPYSTKDVSPEQRISWFASCLGISIGKPGMRHVKVVQIDTDKMVGWACWRQPRSVVLDAQVPLDMLGLERMCPYPEHTNIPLHRAMQQVFADLSKKYLDSETMYCKLRGFLVSVSFPCPPLTLPTPLSGGYLDLIASQVLADFHVLPTFQRRGLGSLMLKALLEEANYAHAPVLLCASNAGRPLYMRFGFRDVEAKTFDLTHLGAGGSRTTTLMLRDAVIE